MLYPELPKTYSSLWLLTDIRSVPFQTVCAYITLLVRLARKGHEQMTSGKSLCVEVLWNCGIISDDSQ